MKRFTLLVVTIFLCAFTLQAQNTKTVKGKVIDDSSGVALPDATIVTTVGGVKKTYKSDASGNFSARIDGDGKRHELIVSYSGYVTKMISTDATEDVNIKLKRAITEMEDVVVIGYQTVKRKDLTGAVASVGAKDLKDIPLNNAAEALSGRLAGVQVTVAEGSPDADISIRVRGGTSLTQDNSPLYIIDGIQVDNGLSTISPQDIETLDVLKDVAATAIYGARGANGVVIITTKSGKDGKNSISYNGFVGLRELPKKLEVMRPYDFVNYQYERAIVTNDLASFQGKYGTTFDTLNVYKDAPFVDWQEEIFGRKAFNQTHNVSFSGGNKTTKYNLSLAHNNEDGIMLQSGYKRTLATFKFDQKASNKFRFGFNVRYNDQLVTGSGTSAPDQNAGVQTTSRLRNTVRYKPLLGANEAIDQFDEEYFDETSGGSLNIFNPIVLVNGEYRKSYTKIFNLSGYGEYTFNKFFTFKTTIGVDNNNSKKQAFNSKYTPTARAAANANLPTASIADQTRFTITNSNVLSFSAAGFKNNFTKNNDLDILIGQETYQKTTKLQTINSNMFSADITPEKALANMQLGTNIIGSPNTYESKETQLSYFGRITYGYKKKYLATFTMRGDASSKFSEQNRWGYFPGASFAWRVSKEKFMSKISNYYLSDLKVRLSYGQAGNNRIDDYQYLTLLSTVGAYPNFSNPSILNPTTIYYYTGSGAGNGNIGFGPRGLGNNSLKWETTTAQNIGLDMGFIKDRIQLSVDIYKNKTKDLLLLQTIPADNGYLAQLQNVGSTENKGIEFQLNAAVVRNKNFTWNMNFNISFNKIKITSLGSFSKTQGSAWNGFSASDDYLVGAGMPIGQMYGYVTDGFYTTDDFDYNSSAPSGSKYVLKAGVPQNAFVPARPGTIKFKDIGGGTDGKPDGIVDSKDKKVIGNATPKYIGGLNQQFSYKNFDVNMFFNFVVGNDIYNANKIEFTSAVTKDANLLAEMNGRWKVTDDQGNDMRDAAPATYKALNANAKIWQPINNSTGSAFQLHSWAVEDGSFLRVNNISLGYSISDNVLKKMKLTKFRFYVTVNNLAVFTKYTGYDPEANTRAKVNPLTPGIDYSGYPRSRSYVAGINLSF